MAKRTSSKRAAAERQDNAVSVLGPVSPEFQAAADAFVASLDAESGPLATMLPAEPDQDAGILVDAASVPNLDTDTLRMLVDVVTEALQQGTVDTAELHAQYAAFVPAARAELASRDAGAMHAAREAAAAAVQEREARLAAMESASAASGQEDSQEAAAPCAQCGQDIQAGQEAWQTDNLDMVHAACMGAYVAALQAAASQPAAAPKARQERTGGQPAASAAPATLYGLPVPPARATVDWSAHRINGAREAIHAARLASQDTPDPDATSCAWCLQGYRDNSVTVVGSTGWSYHKVCADFLGTNPARGQRKPAAPAVQESRIANLESQVAALLAALQAATGATAAAPVAAQEAKAS